MLQAGTEIQGYPRELKPPEEILGREYLEAFQLSRHGRSWVLRRCRKTPTDCVETLPEEVRLGPWVG